MKRSLLKMMFAVIGVLGASTTVSAYNTDLPQKLTGNGLLKTTAGCKNATASIDMDINNVRARLMTGGDMWYNIGTGQPSYEIPKGSQRHSLFAGSCWIGGIDGNGQLKVSAQLFRSRGNDYWPGPIDRVTKNITETECSEWDRFWKVNASTIQEFRRLYDQAGASAIVDEKYDVIKQWPATGNIYAVGANNNSLPELLGPVDEYGYAPFVDVNGDGKYSWTDGDYPASYGAKGSNPSQFVWWVFNDIGNTKTMTKTQSIGMEVQTSAFAYSSTDFLNDATFYNYRLINRGNIILDSCFIATWTDADLGNPFDDYIGCDTARGLGILYNAETPDRANGQNTYGTRLPMIGVDFFIGPRKDYIDPTTGRDTFKLLKMRSFSYFNGTSSGPLRDPNSGSVFYNYMTGSNADGTPFSNDQNRGTGSVGYGSGPIAPFVFYGDPANPAEWSMCANKIAPADRRFIHSAGPFTLKPGAKNDITIGVVWVDDVGACGTASFKKIRAADDIAQSLFDNGFRRTVGPEAPILTIREMDKKLIFYITNPPNSNNYNEQYGDPKYISNDNFRVASAKAKAFGAADSLYRFEGYQVFQLRGPNVSIFDENGKLTKDAVQVFQTDRRNGVGQIVNYSKNLEVKSTVDQYDASIKVDGKDSGIVHSFVLTEDAFATGNKTLVNYKTYYYQVVAYAHNNFAEFNPANEVQTQDKPYLIGDNGPGVTALARYPAMPNSMNQKGDTFSNADYGQGVVITRIEGIGNGGNDVQLSDSSEKAILGSVSNQIAQPTYVAGKGPVNIKVVDPVKVVNSNWRISLLYNGSKSDSVYWGMVDSTKWRIDRLDASGNVIDAIYSERDISVPNEQILDKYGLSVSVSQVYPPGARPSLANRSDSADITAVNGYITSDVTFKNPANPWLTGVVDGSTRSLQNWIRSGTFVDEIPTGTPAPPCGPFDDYAAADPKGVYSLMFANNSSVLSTWAPYDLSATADGNTCGFAPAVPGTMSTTNSLYVASGVSSVIKHSETPNVDLVFTSDKSKWTRCVVLEAQYSTVLSEGNVEKFKPRSHQSWNMGIDDNGNPTYSTVKKDTGFSYFPGYAINQLTGERLNIAFAEDSYLKKFNGNDMLWNPTSDLYNMFGETIFGGRHFTYILNTKYDSCSAFVKEIVKTSPFEYVKAYRQIRWVGEPMLNFGSSLLSLKDGLIPTETRLRFRVNTPYKAYNLMDGQVAANGKYPVYNFSTNGLAPTDYAEKSEADALMDRIFAVPNPYKGQASGGNTYESNRLETKIKIINLPVKAKINIYSLDGTLVRTLEKSNNETYIAWDLYNQAGLPISSGMYLIHVNAYGKDKVIRWFGAMRPIDITNN
jgi:hypothetical protein